MFIYTFPLGQMQANCYFVIQDNSCLIIDPADSADFILEEVQRKNLDIVGLVATHGHFDHVMAAGEIQLSFPHVPFYIHHEDTFLLKRLGETAKYFLGFDPQVIPVEFLEYLEEGKMNIGDFQFEVLHTPGHTPGSCSLYFEKEQTIFTGDTLFKDGIGRYDFKYSDKKLLKESLERLIELPEETEVYPGHGESTLIGNEKSNPVIIQL